MKLTVITSTYNSEKLIKRTFDSILNQLVRPLEYIVIDGCSQDSTIDIIKSYEHIFKEKSIEFKWISDKDTGIYNAWNKGLKLSTGDYISFIGSDDKYISNALCSFKSNAISSKADFVCAKAKITANGKLVRNFGEPFSWKVFTREMKILHSGSFLKNDYIKEYGEFDESFQIVGDYEMLLRKGENLKVKFIDEFLVEMDAGGLSSVEVYSSLKEVRQAKLKNRIRTNIQSLVDLYWVWLKIRINQTIISIRHLGAS